MIDHTGAVYAENETELSADLKGCSLWRKRNKTMTWPILQVQSMPKTKLNCHDRSERVRFMTQSRQDNDVIDHTGVVYAKNRIELS